MDDFTREGHTQTRFFIGPEVEQTPAFNKKTLFVVGLEDTALVENLARQEKAQHIFLSANRSFDSVALVGDIYMVGDTLASDWEKQIQHLLDKGFTVSLDYPAHKHIDLLRILNPGIWQSRNFVPILSVMIPHVSNSSPNLTIKIDDINFKATNPGVWCMHHHEVTDSNRFTDWQDYSSDVILTEEQIASAIPKHLPKHKKVAAVLANSIPMTQVGGPVLTQFAIETKPIGVGAPEVIPEAPVVPEVRDDAAIGLGRNELMPEELAQLSSFEREALKDTDVMAGFQDSKNDSELGLDPMGKSRLKPDAKEVSLSKNTSKLDVVGPEMAADAYADVKVPTDPLGKEASKKPKAKK